MRWSRSIAPALCLGHSLQSLPYVCDVTLARGVLLAVLGGGEGEAHSLQAFVPLYWWGIDTFATDDRFMILVETHSLDL